MRHRVGHILGALGLALVLLGCSKAPDGYSAEAKARAAQLPEPVVNHSPGDALPGQRIAHGELILDVDDARRQLNAQHHSYKVLETRRVPGEVRRPEMKDVKDYALSKSDLDVINPGPGEYVHVMEGQRHGYDNLTIGITYTAPGGAPPMHSHLGEEAHVLTEGAEGHVCARRQAVRQGGALHRQHSRGECPTRSRTSTTEVAELVVIFPTNIWEYDVLDVFPFTTPEAKAMAEEAKRGKAPAPPQ